FQERQDARIIREDTLTRYFKRHQRFSTLKSALLFLSYSRCSGLNSCTNSILYAASFRPRRTSVSESASKYLVNVSSLIILASCLSWKNTLNTAIWIILLQLSFNNL